MPVISPMVKDLPDNDYYWRKCEYLFPEEYRFARTIGHEVRCKYEHTKPEGKADVVPQRNITHFLMDVRLRNLTPITDG